MEIITLLAFLAFLAVLVVLHVLLVAEILLHRWEDRSVVLNSEAVREALQRWTRDVPEAPARHGDEPIPGSGLAQEPDESLLPPEEGDSRLTQQPGRGALAKDVVTPSPRKAEEHSRCPACSAPITANDERCPSCDIAFISDGSLKWPPATVGPADGICLPRSAVSK